MASKRRDVIQARDNSDGSITYRAQIRIRGQADNKELREAHRRDALDRGNEYRNARGHELRDGGRAHYLQRSAREVTPKKKGSDRETDRVRVWMKHPLAARFISQLLGQDFAKYRDERLAEGGSASTVRSELMLISALYKIAPKE